MFTVSVYEPNEAPSVALPDDLDITVPHDGDPATTTFTTEICAASSDPDGDDLVYSWASGEATECITKILEAGEYGYTVTVTDPYGSNSTDDMTVVVNAEPNAAPSVSASSAVVDVYMDIDEAITGFQFDVSGGTLTSAGGGMAEEAGFTISTNETTVIGFSFSLDLIEAGDNQLLSTLTVFPDESGEICISNVVLTDSNNQPMDSGSGGCMNLGDSGGSYDGGDHAGHRHGRGRPPRRRSRRIGRSTQRRRYPAGARTARRPRRGHRPALWLWRK